MLKNRVWVTGLMAFGLYLFGCNETDYLSLIQKGEFTKAGQVIRQELNQNKDMSACQVRALRFELDRMDRIRLDFDQSEEDVVKYIKQYIPEVSPATWRAGKRKRLGVYAD
jgi:hypothetical protein